MTNGNAQGGRRKIGYVNRSDLAKQYLDFLNPDILRPRLLTTSVYIAGFESLKEAVISQPRSLFWTGFDQRGERISPDYQKEVLSRHANPVVASLLWFQEAGAIDAQDLEAYDRLRQCRNRLAHELLDIVSSEGLPEGLDDRFAEMIALIRKLGVWWILNFELATDPDWADKEIDEKEIIPGRQIALQLLCDVALGAHEQSRHWHEGFRERIREFGLDNESSG